MLGVDLDLLLPPVAVHLGSVETARLGTPLLRGTLGLEWSWRPRSRP
ncbi:MAG TPA: hypothetical protein VIK91_21365 [Nannocystis sp.]